MRVSSLGAVVLFASTAVALANGCIGAQEACDQATAKTHCDGQTLTYCQLDESVGWVWKQYDCPTGSSCVAKPDVTKCVADQPDPACPAGYYDGACDGDVQVQCSDGVRSAASACPNDAPHCHARPNRGVAFCGQSSAPDARCPTDVVTTACEGSLVLSCFDEYLVSEDACPPSVPKCAVDATWHEGRCVATGG
jgi:hypothetical protein